MHLSRALFNIVKKDRSILSKFSQQRKLYSYHVDKVPLTSNLLGVLQYSSQTPAKCWNCDFIYKSELFCSKCKALQQLPESLNYFDIIGVKLQYNVSNEEIHQKYRQLQKMLHPDKFGNKSEKEREISGSLSSLVNKAYTTLTDPLKRGLYILKLNNISIPEETTSLEPEFLMKIMEKNEEIENASNDKEETIKLIKENKEMLDTFTKKAADAFQRKDYEEAKSILIKMKYYVSIDVRLKKLKEDLGIVN